MASNEEMLQWEYQMALQSGNADFIKAVSDVYNAPNFQQSAQEYFSPQPNPPAQKPVVAGASNPAPKPAPSLPKFNPMGISNKSFKVAPSDIIQFDETNVEIALITDLLFEDIGAVELANISRSDLIDGIDVSYSPIKNLPVIRRDFNPNNIIATASGNDFFARFGIDIISRGVYDPYFNENGDLVIELDTVGEDEEIQVEILVNGTINVVDTL